MNIYYKLDTGFDPSRGCVLAVGNFDGVHRGHQQVFQQAVTRARETGLEPVLLTFSRHPSSVLRPENSPDPLMALSDRLLIAQSHGFTTAFVLDFDARIATLSPERFVKEILVGRLGVKAVVAGENWRFGHRREGDMAMLTEYGLKRGIEVQTVKPFMVDDLPVSSTRIRGALAAGDVAGARVLLGRPHFVRGTVIGGKGRGRGLGFPTVNLDCHHILAPGDGVYAGGYRTLPPGQDDPERACTIEPGWESMGAAAISIGSSPTFEDGSHAVEAFLVGWESELYGRNVTIAFFDRLRDQHAFRDSEALADQIAADVEKTRDLYSDHEMEKIP